MICSPETHFPARQCVIVSSMKIFLGFVAASVLAISLFVPRAAAQTDNITAGEQMAAPNPAPVNKLTIEDQLKLRAAQHKAAEDPKVKAALQKRNEAIENFRKALHDSMVKIDPKMEAILQKVAVGNSPGF